MMKARIVRLEQQAGHRPLCSTGSLQDAQAMGSARTFTDQSCCASAVIADRDRKHQPGWYGCCLEARKKRV